MKKHIIAGMSIIACVALCAVVWPRSAEVVDLPTEPEKAAVISKIEAQSKEMLPIFIPADAPTPEAEAVAESEPKVTGIALEKETEKLAPVQTAQQVKPAASSSEPRNGDVRVVNGESRSTSSGLGG